MSWNDDIDLSCDELFHNGKVLFFTQFKLYFLLDSVITEGIVKYNVCALFRHMHKKIKILCIASFF